MDGIKVMSKLLHLEVFGSFIKNEISCYSQLLNLIENLGGSVNYNGGEITGSLLDENFEWIGSVAVEGGGTPSM